MRQKADTWLRISVLAWLWLWVLVTCFGWVGIWGMIPLDRSSAVLLTAAAVVLTILAFIVKARWLEALLARFFSLDFPSKRRLSRVLIYTACYSLVVFFAWAFRSRNHFMGDGWALMDKVQGPFAFYHNEPLDFFIHQLFFRWLGIFGVSSGETAYALLHTLLLPLFLLVCWRVATMLVREPAGRAALWLLACGTASLQLFFGYVESYTLLHLWLVVYLFAGIKYLGQEKRTNPWLPTVVFLIAIMTHRSTLVLFPSVVFLWFEQPLLSRRIKRVPGSFLTVSLVSGLALVLALLADKVPGMLPVAGPVDGADVPYRIFEGRHLWDKLNFLLLICPAAAVSAPLLVSGCKKLVGKKDSALIFLFWCAAGSIFFFLAINPHLGIRDWDLFAIPALPLAFFCGRGLVLLLKGKKRANTGLFFLAAVLLLHSLAWVRVNSDLSEFS
ncbi:hypothetical protein ACFL4P_02560 [Gemmatimonadota bacterium]